MEALNHPDNENNKADSIAVMTLGFREIWEVI